MKRLELTLHNICSLLVSKLSTADPSIGKFYLRFTCLQLPHDANL